ncbi:MAG TPA: anti-sigma factor antagonist [Saprospiraceae bacterium]|nr:anti-sigma factor antagonist [Saprospiraceae bacterium]
MKYSVDRQEHFTVFTPAEQNLNSLIAPELKSELFILSQGGVKNLIFDMSNVKFIDSSGLSALLAGNRMWAEGGFLLTQIDSSFVQNLIEISRIDSVIKIVPNLKEAKEYVLSAIGSDE